MAFLTDAIHHTTSGFTIYNLSAVMKITKDRGWGRIAETNLGILRGMHLLVINTKE